LHSKTDAQSSGSFQQYYYYYTGSSSTFAPIVNYKFENNLYLEGRYNYEDLHTASLYVGKTFENSSDFSLSFTPIAGAVFGLYKGASLGANLYVDYKKFSLSYQPQYTLSIASKENNFIYSWSDLTYEISKNFSFGVSAQFTKMYQVKSMVEKGVMLQFSYKNLTLPIYAYNPQSPDRYFLLGLTLEWEGKKRKKTEEKKDPVIPNPVPLIAAKKEKEPAKEEITSTAIAKNPVKPSVNASVAIKKTIPDPANSLYALVVGNFSDLEKANLLKQKLTNAGKRQVSVYPEGNVYKLRMTGFADRKEAETFKAKFLSNISANTSFIQAYKIEKRVWIWI